MPMLQNHVHFTLKMSQGLMRKDFQAYIEEYERKQFLIERKDMKVLVSGVSFMKE